MNRPVTSAHNLFRRELCPGSERMEYGLPEEDSEDSRIGVLLHDYHAHPEYERALLRPDQRELLTRNDSLLNSIALKIGGHIGGSHKWTETFRERRMSNSIISGTSDIYYSNPAKRVVWINDSKFGFKIVERAEGNLQLRAYAVLASDTEEERPERIFTSITQPRVAYEERITLAEYSAQDIEDSRQQIEHILKKSASDNAKLVAGEEQCRYCKAKLICPAFQKMMTLPVIPYKPQQELSVRAREEYLQKRLLELSDKQLEKVLVACSFAAMLKPVATDEARKRIAAGTLSNYFLSKPSVTREIVDPQKAISLLELGKIMSREDILAACSLPLGKIEESYRDRHDVTWKEAREKIGRILNSVIEKTEQKPKVLRK